MAEYIDREAVLRDWPMCDEPADAYQFIRGFTAADVVEPKTCKNLAAEYNDCDQFACSYCGIELQDWRRVELDEDDGDVTYHEYRFRFCPNCGAKIDDSSENQNWDMANIHTDDCWRTGGLNDV